MDARLTHIHAASNFLKKVDTDVHPLGMTPPENCEPSGVGRGPFKKRKRKKLI